MKPYTLILFPLALLFFQVASVTYIEAGNQYKRYKIKKGDNLTKIAQNHGISISEILAINNIKPNKILAGQTINIIPLEKKRKEKGTKIQNYKKVYLSHVPKFQNPVKKTKLLRKFDLKGEHRTPGVVWYLKKSSRVHSSQKGRVAKIGYLRGYGKYIIIDHGNSWISLYSKLSNITVNKGNWVKAGQKIGTGKNKKLFFSISYRGKPMNPILLLKQNKKNKITLSHS